MNPRLLFVFLFFCLGPFCSAQNETRTGTGPASHTYRDIKGPENHKTFYVENIKKPDQRVKLPQHHVILLVNEQPGRADVLSRINTMECFFDTLLGDSLSVRIINEEIEVERRHMYSNITNNYYAGSFTASYRKISVAELRYLSMKSPIRTKLTRIGVVVMSLSVLTLVATPFVGIGMDGGDKAQRREQVFLAGISGFGVSIPFFVFGRNKKYGLQKDINTTDDNYWVIKQKR